MTKAQRTRLGTRLNATNTETRDITSPSNKADSVSDNLPELVRSGAVGGISSRFSQLPRQYCLAELSQLVVRWHAEEGTVEEAILLPVLIVFTLDEAVCIWVRVFVYMCVGMCRHVYDKSEGENKDSHDFV